VAAVAVGLHRQALAAGLDADHRGVGAPGDHNPAEADHVVVLLEDPFLRSDGGPRQQPEQRFTEILRRGQRERVERLQRVELLGPRGGPVVDGRAVGEGRHREIRADLLALEDPQAPGVGDGADHRGGEIPAVEDLHHLMLAAALGDDQHPLLRLGEHDLVRRHPLLAAWDLEHVEIQSAPRSARHLG
jgi:hypothetical protein